MQVVNAVTQGMSAIEERPSDCQTQKMLRSQQLRVAQAAQNGFISRDMQARLNVTPEELLAIRNSSVRLLGGDRKKIVQEEITLEPGGTFAAETDASRGRKVYIETKGDAKVHTTVVYDKRRVLYSGLFSGTKNFADGLSDGHFQLTLKNTSSQSINVYVHMEDECPGDCTIM